jgi:hypothetical protein
MKKKGLSGIVMTIILIALVLVAVFIVWTIISNLLEDKEEEVVNAPVAQIIKVQKVFIENDGKLNITFKRLLGPGPLQKIRVVLTNGVEEEEIFIDTNIKEDTSESHSLTPTIINPTKVFIYPVTSDGDKDYVGVRTDKKDICLSLENCDEANLPTEIVCEREDLSPLNVDYSGYSPSIIVDSEGKIHISHQKVRSTGEIIIGELHYCVGSSGSWDCKVVDTEGRSGYSSSLAIDSLGGIHIAHADRYYDKLRYCYRSGEDWSCEEIEGSNGASVMAVDSKNVAHIVHRKGGWNFPPGARYCSNPEGVWECQDIETLSDCGGGADIFIDSQDKVHFIEPCYSWGSLRYCSNVGGWSCENVEFNEELEENGASSIFVDSSGNVHLTHKKPTSPGTRYCIRSGGEWNCETIGSNYGYSSSTSVDSEGVVHVGYTTKTTNEISHCTGSFGEWDCQHTLLDGGNIWEGDISFDNRGEMFVAFRGNGLQYFGCKEQVIVI